MSIAQQLAPHLPYLRRYARDNYRRVVEMIKKGVIGPVKEVHVWVGGAWNGNGTRPAGKPVPPPADLRIIGVQLPIATTGVPVTSTLASYVVEGIWYILVRSLFVADRL